MSLSPGTTFGPYSVQSKLGVGGMGEVYSATDTKLERQVAIKILPEAFARDTDRLARFEREAKTLAALNHPNIAQIYGVEDEGTVHALVMEFVPGPTLADHLSAAPGRTLPLEESMAIARQLVDALEAAHEHGIIHRDLKPANVKVRPDGTVKVLDFGLAKAGAGDASSSDPFASPAMSAAMTSPAMTAQGIILGTAAYMAPEQARGRAVDKRADVWAFGVVLYEMLAGGTLFGGDTISDTIAAVLTREVDWAALPADVPARIRTLLRRCLERDPRRRLRDIGDARLFLEEGSVIDAGTQPRDVPARRRPAVVGLVLAALGGATVAAAALLVSGPWNRHVDALVLRSTLLPPPGETLLPEPAESAISPDGRQVAFVTGRLFNLGALIEHAELWVRPLDSLNARLLPGTSGAQLPFWSPDGERLGFFANGKLETIVADGSQPQTVCAVPDGRGATWGSRGVIVFAPASAGALMKVQASGGDPTPVTTLDSGSGQTGHRFPWFLPDGDHFLYAALPSHDGRFGIFLGSISTGLRQHVLDAETGVVYAEPGYLIYGRGGHLVAQRFDASRFIVSGDPIPLGDAVGGIQQQYYADRIVTPSAGGTLLYLHDPFRDTDVVTIDPVSGRILETLSLPAAHYVDAALAPDGTHAVVGRTDASNAEALWLADLVRGGATPLATGNSGNAVFSTDGEHVAFSSPREGPEQIFIKATFGAAAETPLFRSPALFKKPRLWTRGGQLIFEQSDSKTGLDLWVVPVAGDRTPKPYLASPYDEDYPAISPDGRWLAYLSDETGRPEGYIQSFPVPGRKVTLTTDGATWLWWRADGRAIVVLGADGRQLSTVDVEPGPAIGVGQTHPLARLPQGTLFVDVAPDARRVLAVVSRPGAALSLTVVQNWTSLIGQQ